MPSSLRSPLAPRSCRRIGLRPFRRPSRMSWQRELTGGMTLYAAGQQETAHAADEEQGSGWV